ncbi:MAG: glycosyltransferase family 39 protein [bacterium]
MTKNALRVLIIVFLIKLAFALLPSFEVDMGAWLAWASRLTQIGTANFYSDSVWTQYTPGFLYWLWFIGNLGWIHPLAIKIPVIIADILTGWLIWQVVRKVNLRWASLVAILYVLNPVIIFDGSVWGQIDGIMTFFMFLSAYLLIERKNSYWSWMMAGVAMLMKPQAMAIVPLLALITLIRYGWKKLIVSGCLGILVVVIGFYPFYPTNPVLGIFELLQKMGVSYSYTSLFAFNWWSWVGMWKPDNTLWGGITFFGWGTMGMLLAYGAIVGKYRNQLRHNATVYLLLALACFIFFLFPTRVHERYLFPMFAYLITYTGLRQQKSLLWIVGITSAIYLANLYLPYSYYEQTTNILKNEGLQNLIERFAPVMAALLTIVFGILTFWEELSAKFGYFQVGKRRKKKSQYLTGRGNP